MPLGIEGRADRPVLGAAAGRSWSPLGAFTLTAKADRIDRLTGGGAAIYDYKTGAPPSEKQIEQGFNQQLHLQAAILMGGGFADIGRLDARSGAYLGLTGADEGGKLRAVEDLSAEVAGHMERLATLIAAYDRIETPYISRGRAEKQSFEGDYDHLARRGEWDGAGDGGGE